MDREPRTMGGSGYDPPSMPLPRVYLAGPEVFLLTPHAIADAKKALCTAHGFEGVFPLDGDLDLTGLAAREQAKKISAANEALIRGCQLVVANVTPFRGPSADVGTAYEMGFARGLGLPVFAYSNLVAPFAERVSAAILGGAKRRADGALADEHSMSIEPFGLLDNLMLEGAVDASGARICVHAADPSDLFTDLTAFKACLRQARDALHR